MLVTTQEYYEIEPEFLELRIRKLDRYIVEHGLAIREDALDDHRRSLQNAWLERLDDGIESRMVVQDLRVFGYVYLMLMAVAIVVWLTELSVDYVTRYLLFR